jgi:hypothetical protein
MAPFRKKDEHAGSGLDKPERRSLIARIAGRLKSRGAPKPSGKPS